MIPSMYTYIALADQPAFPALVSSVSWVMIVQFVVLPILLPLFVGVISNSKWSTLAKRLSLGGTTLLTSLATGYIGAATSGTKYDIGMAIFSWVLSWGVAELAYWKLLKLPATPSGDTSLASLAQSVGNK